MALAGGPCMCLSFSGPAGWLCAPAIHGMGLAASPRSQARRTGSALMCGAPRETAEEAALRRGGGRGTKGLYVRPSKALEVGGGFYVPGLEGYRLRVAIVGLVFTLLTLNRLLLPGYEPQFTQVRQRRFCPQRSPTRYPAPDTPRRQFAMRVVALRSPRLGPSPDDAA